MKIGLLYILLFLVLAPLANHLDAQSIDSFYFSELSTSHLHSVNEGFKTRDGFILAGYEESGNDYIPVILRIDSIGKVIWSSKQYLAPIYTVANRYKFQMAQLEEDFVYAISLNKPDSNTNDRYLWKLDYHTGEVMWYKKLPVDELGLIKMSDYDSEKLVLLYPDDFNDYNTIALVDKESGDYIDFHTTEFTYSDDYDLAVDHNKNLYVGYAGRLIKLSGRNFRDTIWTATYEDLPAPPVAIQKLYIDDRGKLFLFGNTATHKRPVLLNIKTATGEAIWSTLVSNTSSDVRGVSDSDGFLYVNYQHKTVGSTIARFRVAKVGKANGAVLWESMLNTLPLPYNYSEEQSALAIDTECPSDIFVTGYSGSANYQPGAWTSMRIARATGEKVFDVTLTMDSTIRDTENVGTVVGLLNDNPYVVGNMRDTDDRDNAYIAALELESGSPRYVNKIKSNYQHPSFALDFAKEGDRNFLLRQEGELIYLSAWNDAGDDLWTRLIPTPELSSASHLKIVDDKVFVLRSALSDQSATAFFQPPINNISLLAFSANNGTQVLNDPLIGALDHAYLYDFELDSDGSGYVFYMEFNALYVIRWENNSVSLPAYVGAQTSINVYPASSNFSLNYNEQFLLLLTNGAITQINKLTLEANSVYNFIAGEQIVDISANENSIFLAGSISGKPLVIALERESLDLIWKKEFDENGKMVKTAFDSESKCYAVGNIGNGLNIVALSSNDATVIWEQQIDSSSYRHLPLNVVASTDGSSVVVAGAAGNSSFSKSDAFFFRFDDEGIMTYKHYLSDDLNAHSFASPLLIKDASSYFVGGAHNEKTPGKQGFIFDVDFLASNLNIPTNIMEDNWQPKIFPNPTISSIDLLNVPVDHSVNCYDVLGRRQELNQIANFKYDTNFLIPGIYYLKIARKGVCKVLSFVKQ